jgi:cytochrome c-type biogenesis protein CcmE
MKESLKTGLKGRGKFFIGGGLILAAIIYLIVSATQANAEYFMTVNELVPPYRTIQIRWI